MKDIDVRIQKTPKRKINYNRVITALIAAFAVILPLGLFLIFNSKKDKYEHAAADTEINGTTDGGTGDIPGSTGELTGNPTEVTDGSSDISMEENRRHTEDAKTVTDPEVPDIEIYLTELPAGHLINFKAVLQNPGLPTGCEITALTAVLNYYGFDVTKTFMADNYLIKDVYGASDFNTAFIGEPEKDSGYGCYAPVIVNTANLYFADVMEDTGAMKDVIKNSQYDYGSDFKLRAFDISGTEFSELFPYVAQGVPVIVWATMGLIAPNEKYVWTLPDNTPVYWMENEHCAVLIGYDVVNKIVTVADPLNGIHKYDTELFELRYNQMGRQAVVLNCGVPNV